MTSAGAWIGRTTGAAIVAIAALSAGARPAWAHHEAIFGPQSSLVLSAPAFASMQSYTRRLGEAGTSATTQESTVLVSAGVTPFRRVPLSFTIIAPASLIENRETGANRRGLEDIVLGTRYRVDLGGLQERWGKDGNFVLGMAALELPTGSIDHPTGHGALDSMAAGLVSLERGAFSGIAYGFYRHHGTDGNGYHVGDNVFVGGGAAWTPFDDSRTERLLSLQLGVSYETYLANQLGGRTVATTGGAGLYAHPTVVWGPGGHVLAFAVVSLPVAQDYANPAESNRWRAGAGVLYLFQ